MFKLIPVLLLGVLLAACSGGGGSSSSEDQKPGPKTNPDDFVLTQSSDLIEFGQTRVKMELKNLVSDDAVYVTVSAGEIDNNQLKVIPTKTMLNPSEGQTAFTFDVQDNGLKAEPELSINVTTAGNTNMVKTIKVKMAE